MLITITTSVLFKSTDEHLLTSLIADRSPSDLYLLNQAYRARHRRTLEEAVKGDLSGKTERSELSSL